MKTEYKRDLKNNYLVIEADSEMNMEEYIVHMTEQNRIAGLLPMQMRKMDGSCYMYYDITAHQTMESRYEKKVLVYQDILHILSEVQEVLESVRKYLLNPQHILFDPQYTYINTENTQLSFCYFPSSESNLSITVLAEYILKKLDHEDTKAVSVGYSFYQRATEENFSLTETLHEILEGDWKENKKRGTGTVSSGQEKESPVKASYVSGYEADEKKDNRNKTAVQKWEEDEVFHKERKRQKTYCRLFHIIHPAVLIGMLLAAAGLEVLLYFGWIDLTEAGGLLFLTLAVSIMINRFWRKKKDENESDYGMKLEENEKFMKENIKENMKEDMEALKAELYQSPKCTCEEKTEYLSESYPESSMMILESECLEKYPSIRLQNRVLIVGKTKGQADILLQDAAVSRIHARLEQRNGSCYVRDLNSKNGTYINGVRLRPQEEMEIKEGDSVIFANIRYFVSVGAEDSDRTQLLR